MTKKKKKKGREELDPVQRDITLLIILAASVLIFVSMLGFCGIIGVGLRFLLFGFFGLPAFVLPILAFFVSAYVLANKERSFVKRQLLGLIGFFIFVCALCQLVLIGFDPTYSVFQIFADNAERHIGGGFFGGIVIEILGSLIGVIGAYIVVIAALFVFAIIMTQKPLVSKMKDNTQVIYRRAKEEREKNKKERDDGQKKSKTDRKNVFLPKLDFPKHSSERENGPFLFEEEAALDGTNVTEITMDEADGGKDSDTVSSNPQEAGNKGKEHAKKNSDDKLEISSASDKIKGDYKIPPVSLLNKGNSTNTREMNSQVRETAGRLQQTLHNFGVEATVVNASCGPTVTRYELQPEQGVKVSKIVNLTDDIKLNLAAADIRIEAPIPGKAAIGIEVPNKTNNSVALRELIDTAEFRNSKSKLSFAVGKDLSGRPVIFDITKMPHLLIAGSTGSGKSVCINTLIMSIIYKARPDEVKMMMIDPKVVELSVYNGIPHLLCPVVTDPKKAAGALQWAVTEMTRRYNLFAEFAVRDLKGYNKKAAELAAYAKEGETKPEILPQIIIIVDELADLMMAAPGEVEDAICRLAQLARAAGLHLVIATQRPSVNVITGLIKANMPSRIALSVTSGIDSRVIIDMNGAEKLLGKGDMLFYPAGYQKPARVQGGFVSDEEIQKVVDYISKKEAVYSNEVQEAIESAPVLTGTTMQGSEEQDVYFADAGRCIIEKDKASIGLLQRVFKVGFNRAARIMDQLCEAGVVGEEEGTKPRKILMSLEQFENYLEEK